MTYFCIARHGRAVNVLFLDGHAARVPLSELWKLQWHRGFEKHEITGLL
jgi:prepilin-type processing-associated H-X9-DG protein